VKAGLIRTVVGITVLAIMMVRLPSSAQGSVTSAALPEGSPPYVAAQLDQILAPIALYPDPLLTQILTAATYPLEVIQAARWLQNPANAVLTGDQLTAALETQLWDPSVKSLVPFPQVLKMMDSRLDWMQKLGDAFLTQPDDVMNAVQRLRRQAQAAGTLATTPQQVVTTVERTIVIEPASPAVVYLPCYNPVLVYGIWPYPAYPPFYYPFPGCYPGPRIDFGFGIVFVRSLWGWVWCDWRHHRIHVDYHRYNVINRYNIDHHHRPRLTADIWKHEPYHRRGVAYPNLVTRERYRHREAEPPKARREFRGFEQPAAPQARRAPTPRQVERAPEARRMERAPAAPRMERAPEAPRMERAPAAPRMERAPVVPQMERAPVVPRMERAPAVPRMERAPAAPQVMRAPPPPESFGRPSVPAREGFGTPRSEVRAYEYRGRESRQSMMPSARPERAAPRGREAPSRGAAPRGGGGRRRDAGRQD